MSRKDGNYVLLSCLQPITRQAPACACVPHPRDRHCMASVQLLGGGAFQA